MIVIELMGGLGNQMYQYAFGRSLSLQLNTELYLNTNTLKEHATPREYELKYFNVKAEIADKNVLDKFINNKFNILNRYWLSIVSLGKYAKIKEEQFKEDIVVKNNTFYKGYFQNEKYFNKIKTILVNDFTLKLPLDDINGTLQKEISNTESVFVHIRRGDFLTSNGFHKVYGKEFYEKAIKDTINKYGENLKFYFFSDDINWVKNNFEANNYFYINHNIANDSYKDLILMSHCKYAIFANSTFAWWANWFRENNKNE